MKRHFVNFARWAPVAASLVVFVAAAWLWYHSMSCMDRVYRTVQVPGGNEMRGVGSYRGALLIGSIFETSTVPLNRGYRHDLFPIVSGGRKASGPSVLEARPSYKISGLGFGISRGELKCTLPFSFFLPVRTYQAVYIPYYFIMLITAIAPGRMGWKIYRLMRRRKIHRSSMVEEGVEASTEVIPSSSRGGIPENSPTA